MALHGTIMFKTRKSDGRVFNDNKQRSDKHHGSVKPSTGIKNLQNSRKSSSRAHLVKELIELSPEIWMKDGGEFDKMYEGTIWTGEGSSLKNDGEYIFTYPQQVNPAVQKILDRNNWYAEWYDNGTVFLIPEYYKTAKITDDDFPIPSTEKLSYDDYQKKQIHEFMSKPENKSQFDALMAGLAAKGITPPKK